MISMDWKERLKKDTDDFFERKLKDKDFDIDIVYNAYPTRIDNKIPKEVIIYIAKTLAGKLAKKAVDYIDFYDYLWEQKGENGRLALAYILARLVKKDEKFFIDYIEKLIKKTKNEHDVSVLLDKAVFPVLRKNPKPTLDKLIRSFSGFSADSKVSVIKTIIKLCKADHDLFKPVFKKLEAFWLNAEEEMVNINIIFLKAMQKIEPEFYYSIFVTYKNTRNPIFVEILSGSIVSYDEKIEEAVNIWVKSGNARLKKAALAGQKVLKRKKGV